MTIEQVKRLYEARPFRPFTMHLADGRRVGVEHPDFMASAPSGRTVIVYESNDAFHIIDLLLVTGLEVKSNGAHKKKH